MRTDLVQTHESKTQVQDTREETSPAIIVTPIRITLPPIKATRSFCAVRDFGRECKLTPHPDYAAHAIMKRTEFHERFAHE